MENVIPDLHGVGDDPTGGDQHPFDLDLDDLSPSERAYADLRAEGIDEAALIAEIRTVPVLQPDGSVVITLVEDGAQRTLTVTSLSRVPNLRSPLATALAVFAKGMSDGSFRSRESDLVPFIEYLVDRDMSSIRLRDIHNATLDEFRDWLDDYEKPKFEHKKKPLTSVFPTTGGGKLKVSTKARYMSVLLSLLKSLRVDGERWLDIDRDLDLVRGDDWTGLGSDRDPVKILTRPQLKMLVRVCREEVTQTTLRLRDAWAVMDGREPERPIDSMSRALLLEVKALHKHFNGRPPKQQALAKAMGADDRTSFPILRRLKTLAYNAALATIYPTGRLLTPFLLLFAIYYRYNRSVVTTMRASHFSEQPSLRGGLRLRGMPFKNRAGKTQYASWPITKDPHNPNEMMDTLEIWTERVRRHAQSSEVNHMFLERGRESQTRSLARDWALNPCLVQFMRDHEASLKTRFEFRALRPSVINLVHHLFDGDLLATAEAGQHAVRTMVDHYLFDGARKTNEEALIPAMHARDAWRQSGGKSDGRADKRRGDLSAATPGFTCKDRYDSRMPGQLPNRLCTAYGMCPVCILGKPDISSPEAYALVVKLWEAIDRSRSRMSAESWIERWSAVADEIDRKTERSFPQDVKDRADLDIPQLPTVE